MTTDWPLYEVFIRVKSGLSHRHAGSVARLSPLTRRIQRRYSSRRKIKFIATRLFMKFLKM